MSRRPFYPIFVDLQGRRVLVVGGGAIAERKARSLARCGARVVVVAPAVRPALRRLAEVCFQREFCARDVVGASLVISAADDELVNARVSALCRRRGVWANVVDRPALCDFIAPSVASRGRVTLAVSTGGASPALARDLRRRLERSLTPADAKLAARLARERPRLLRMPIAERRRVLAGIMGAS